MTAWRRARLTGGGSLVSSAANTSAVEAPRNGVVPVAISYITVPRLKRSVLASSCALAGTVILNVTCADECAGTVSCELSGLTQAAVAVEGAPLLA